MILYLEICIICDVCNICKICNICLYYIFNIFCIFTGLLDNIGSKLVYEFKDTGKIPYSMSSESALYQPTTRVSHVTQGMELVMGAGGGMSTLGQ